MPILAALARGVGTRLNLFDRSRDVPVLATLAKGVGTLLNLFDEAGRCLFRSV